MRKNREEQAKINDARVRNMLDNLPKIRCQLAGYHDDLRKIEHDVYEFNKKFSGAIRAIHAVEMFYPGEEKAADEKLKSNIIPFPARNPRTGEAVSVPAHRVIYFKPAKKLKAIVKELPE
jgi:hypothetical protein